LVFLVNGGMSVKVDCDPCTPRRSTDGSAFASPVRRGLHVYSNAMSGSWCTVPWVRSWRFLSFVGFCTIALPVTVAIAQQDDETCLNCWYPEDRPSVLKDQLRGATSGGHEMESMLKVMHITDPHMSLEDASPPYTTRMHKAFEKTRNDHTGAATTPPDEFLSLLQLAEEEKVDLILLGGDVVNFPCSKSVAWTVEALRRTGIPFVFTAGNHDWHEEGHPDRPRYDDPRVPSLNSTLFPLIKASLIAPTRTLHGRWPHQGLLYGKTTVNGFDVLFFDNSNLQIDDEQLEFAHLHLAMAFESGTPVILLLHVPLYFSGTDLAVDQVCGHPLWGGATDPSYRIEQRPRWPDEGNLPSTGAFINLVKAHAAPAGPILAVLTGHIHRHLISPLVDVDRDAYSSLQSVELNVSVTSLGRRGCALEEASISSTSNRQQGSSVRAPEETVGALQYTTHDAAHGGYRVLSVMYSRRNCNSA